MAEVTAMTGGYDHRWNKDVENHGDHSDTVTTMPVLVRARIAGWASSL
jgi:hypothetical protein